MTLQELVKLHFNYWLGEIPLDDERWYRIIELRKDLCPEGGFDKWLDNRILLRTPHNAMLYLKERHEIAYGEQERTEAVKAHEELRRTNDSLMFQLLLEKRLRQYKDKPYQGPLAIGHFVGIKSSLEEDPLKIEYHNIGMISDYQTDGNGNIKSLVLKNKDGSSITMPIAWVYRIY